MAQESEAGGDRLISIGKAAELLGVSVGTLRAWADKGLVHTIRLPSGYRRFTKGEIDEMRRRMGYEE
jgi:excisionase family DNA binding protein